MAYLDDLIAINGLPLLACLAVSGILVYLGMHVVERKVIFVDLALAQIAALGVMWAILMGYDHEKETLAVTLYSLAFTAVGALVFSITRTKNERVPHEALIGIIYVTATAGGLVLADRFALGTEALKELIAGRVALVTPAILTKLVVSCAVVGAAFLGLHRRLLKISTDPKGAERLIKTGLDAFGRIDAVVNNAGILRDRIFHRMSHMDWKMVIDVHLNGAFNVSRAAANYFKEQKSGAFVHFTSTSGLVGNFGQANYSAAKMGIIGLSRSIALDMAAFNVRSNCISPFAWTRMIGTIPADTEAQKVRLERAKKMTPAKIAPMAAGEHSDA